MGNEHGGLADGDGHVLLRFADGAQGTLIISQVAPGNECGLRIRIYGGVKWTPSAGPLALDA